MQAECAAKTLVATSDIFRRVGPSTTARIVQAGTIRTVAQHEVVFRQGDEATWLYFLLEGSVLSDLDGLVVSVLRPGAVGGGSGLLIPGARRSQTHTAVSPSQCNADRAVGKPIALVLRALEGLRGGGGGSDGSCTILQISEAAFRRLLGEHADFREAIIVHFGAKNRRKNVLLAQALLQKGIVHTGRAAASAAGDAQSSAGAGERPPAKKVVVIAVFDTKPYDRTYLSKAFGDLSQSFPHMDFALKFLEVKLSKDTAALATGCDAACIFVNDDASEEPLRVLRALGVQLVLLRCAGFNNVNVEVAVRQCGMSLARVPAYSPYAVAEHAFALLMSVNRHTHTSYNRVRCGNFSLSGLEGRDLHGLTCAVIGAGKIGQCFARIAAGCGMKVILWDLHRNPAFEKEIGATFEADMDAAMRVADVISFHVPLVPQTKHLLNAKRIADVLKPGVMVVNTSRGPVIDAEALIDGLISGKIAGAGLDVYEHEKEFFFEDRSSVPIKDPVLARLVGMPNVLITSHQAFLTSKALNAIASTTAQNAKEYFVEKKQSKQMTNAVLPPPTAAKL